jgi:hypothetical protein
MDFSEFSLFTTAASGSCPEQATDAAIEQSLIPSTSTPTLQGVRDYFLDRISELEHDCKSGTPWVFISMAVMLEYLAALVVDPQQDNPNKPGTLKNKNDLQRYQEFVEDWMPSDYKDFQFPSGDKDLPLQMYCILRSAMVHSFSMIPTGGAPARPGSIAICHASSGNKHLGSYKQNVACFVAEVFLKDIRTTVLYIFEKAQQDSSLETKIIEYVKNRPPLTLITLST